MRPVSASFVPPSYVLTWLLLSQQWMESLRLSKRRRRIGTLHLERLGRARLRTIGLTKGRAAEGDLRRTHVPPVQTYGLDTCLPLLSSEEGKQVCVRCIPDVEVRVGRWMRLRRSESRTRPVETRPRNDCFSARSSPSTDVGERTVTSLDHAVSKQDGLPSRHRPGFDSLMI